MGQQQYDMNNMAANMPRSSGLDPNGISALESFGLGSNPLFAGINQNHLNHLNAQQLQYQAILQAQANIQRPQNGFYSPTPSSISSFAPATPQFDHYRPTSGMGSPAPQAPPQMTGSPMMGHMAMQPPGFNPLMASQLMSGGYQYPAMNGLQYVPPQQGGRRGRR
jgi:hypothetical protein